MSGRYGFDLLSQVLMIIGMILCLSKYTFMLGITLIVLGGYRVFSKDFAKRRNELYIFETWIGKTFKTRNGSSSSFIDNIKRYFKEKLNFKILTCPKCGQKLRVPRKKGKIVITCKKCFYEFKAKS